MDDKAFNLVMDCGEAMLASGGEVFRTQDTMNIMAASFGIPDFRVYVLASGVFASARGGTVSAVRHVPTVSINLSRVEALNALSRRVADGGLDVDGAEREFRRAVSGATFSPALTCLAAALGAGCFAFLFGGGLIETVTGTLAGLLEGIVCAVLARRRVSRIFRDILAASAGTLTVLALRLAYGYFSANIAIIGALMVLTPGVSLTMGIRDIINGDYLSGGIRLMDALLVAGCLAFGVTLGYAGIRIVTGVIL